MGKGRGGKGQVFKMSGIMADINHVFQSASAGSRSSRMTESWTGRMGDGCV